MTQDSVRDYKPIACGLHDRLEALATMREEVPLRYLDADGAIVEVVDRIADLYARQGEEFLRTGGGAEIRLDRLCSVAGVPFGPH
jgi:Rho-binding antiterminator